VTGPEGWWGFHGSPPDGYEELLNPSWRRLAGDNQRGAHFGKQLKRKAMGDRPGKPPGNGRPQRTALYPLPWFPSRACQGGPHQGYVGRLGRLGEDPDSKRDRQLNSGTGGQTKGRVVKTLCLITKTREKYQNSKKKKRVQQFIQGKVKLPG